MSTARWSPAFASFIVPLCAPWLMSEKPLTGQIIRKSEVIEKLVPNLQDGVSMDLEDRLSCLLPLNCSDCDARFSLGDDQCGTRQHISCIFVQKTALYVV
jgi:hypothetical protein